MNMEKQDKQDKLDQKDDLQITENGSNDLNDQRVDPGGEKEIDKEKDRERDIDSKKPRKTNMESFRVNRFQRGMVDVLKRARSFLDGRGTSLTRTQKRREAAVPKLWEDTHETIGLDTLSLLYTKIPNTLRLQTDEMRSKMTSLQECSRPSQEIESCAWKTWERCVYVSLRHKENSEKHMRWSRDAHLLVTVAMSDVAEVQEGSL